jgi:hypothetical protein
MSLKSAMDNLKFDSRMIEINLKNQSITKDEYKKYLDKLSDVKNVAIPLDIESAEDHDSMTLNGESHN